jgi:hypothetical protein
MIIVKDSTYLDRSLGLRGESMPMVSTALVLALGFGMVASDTASARFISGPGTADEVLIVPTRVHILTSPDFGMANCTLRDSDITRVFGKLNAIWSQAGITFGIESVVKEPVAQRERFRLVVEFKNGELDLPDLDLLLPKASRVFEGVNVYCFHELPFNSIYMGGDCVIVQERAKLNEVAGGTDDPMARAAGHCLGRALSLVPRRESETSLMALGTTGFALDADEVARARRVAKTVPGAMTLAQVRKAAETAQAAGDATRAKLLKSWIDAAGSAKSGGPARAKPSQDGPNDKQKRQRRGELTAR